MPVADRWEPVRTLKKDPRTGNIPIIGMSAYAEASERERAMATGCNEFDAKPIQFESLLATVREGLLSPNRCFADEVIAATHYVGSWHKAAVRICVVMSAAGVVSRRRESVMLYER
jgi:CheY-like chemotaxis protein